MEANGGNTSKEGARGKKKHRIFCMQHKGTKHVKVKVKATKVHEGAIHAQAIATKTMATMHMKKKTTLFKE